MIKSANMDAGGGCCIGSHATDASDFNGKHDAFFMDEVSIFRNPANINLY